ncbi:MAG: hypothetical protein ACR2NN_04660 [Bryobacteraceae bacterium]
MAVAEATLAATGMQPRRLSDQDMFLEVVEAQIAREQARERYSIKYRMDSGKQKWEMASRQRPWLNLASPEPSCA